MQWVFRDRKTCDNCVADAREAATRLNTQAAEATFFPLYHAMLYICSCGYSMCGRICGAKQRRNQT